MRSNLCIPLSVATALILSITPSVHAEESADYHSQLTLFSLKQSPPTIDGVLDDDCWTNEHVQRGKGFVRLMDAGKIEPPSADAIDHVIAVLSSLNALDTGE